MRHIRPEPGTHLYVGKRSYTVTRLYPHLPWTVRDDAGWPLAHFNSLKRAEAFLQERETAGR